MSPRCFVALELTGPSSRVCDAAARAFRSHAPRWRDQKWVSAGNMHITLAFLGEVDDHLHEPLGQAVTDALSDAPAPLLRGPRTVAVRARRSSMLWVEFEDEGGFAAELARSVRRVTGPFVHDRVSDDTRPWRAHVTVCRTRTPLAAPPEALRASDAELAALGDESMSHPVVTLVTSRLTPRGAEYTRTATWRLRGELPGRANQ